VPCISRSIISGQTIIILATITCIGLKNGTRVEKWDLEGTTTPFKVDFFEYMTVYICNKE
jgi:hypothetical protein